MINRFIVTLGLVAASLVAATAQTTEPTVLANFPSGLNYALDGDVFYFATLEENGADATITIYNNDDFSVKEQFTLKGVNSYATNSNGDEVQTTGISYCGCEIYSAELEGDLIVTRGVFTNDNKWSVVVYNEEKSEEGYYDDSAMYLYSSDNKKICELPTNMYFGIAGAGSICFANRLSGKPYYVTEDRGNGDLHTHTVWTFDDVNGVVTPRAVAQSVTASPNPLPAGATLNIDLEFEADDNTILTITGMDGRQAYRTRVRPGEVGVQVPAKFSRGVYVYTVIYGNGETYSGKVAAE